MQHCCKFKADDIYFLTETNLFAKRTLSFGFCPICKKQVAELVEVRFDGVIERFRASGDKAQALLLKLKDDIVYSASSCNYKKVKSRPYGWKYGVNKMYKVKGQQCIKQFAYDFYGNKEIVKIL